MKNLITAIASIIILLVILMQFVSNQVLHDKLTRVDKVIFSFQEVLKVDGIITGENKAETAEALSEAVGCSSKDIIIEGEAEEKYRGEKIPYKVGVPLEDIVSSFWGIENSGTYYVNGETISQRIDRRSNW